MLKCQQHLQVVAIAMVTGWSTIGPAVADDAVSSLILLTNWCYTKMAIREIIMDVFLSHCPHSSVACIFGFQIKKMVTFNVISVSVESCILVSVWLLVSTETEITTFGQSLVSHYHLSLCSIIIIGLWGDEGWGLLIIGQLQQMLSQW